MRIAREPGCPVNLPAAPRVPSSLSGTRSTESRYDTTSVRLDVCKIPTDLSAIHGLARPTKPQGSVFHHSRALMAVGLTTPAQPRTGTVGPDARRAVRSVVSVALRAVTGSRLGGALINPERVGLSTWSGASPHARSAHPTSPTPAGTGRSSRTSAALACRRSRDGSTGR